MITEKRQESFEMVPGHKNRRAFSGSGFRGEFDEKCFREVIRHGEKSEIAASAH